MVAGVESCAMMSTKNAEFGVAVIMGAAICRDKLQEMVVVKWSGSMKVWLWACAERCDMIVVKQRRIETLERGVSAMAVDQKQVHSRIDELRATERETQETVEAMRAKQDEQYEKVETDRSESIRRHTTLKDSAIGMADRPSAWPMAAASGGHVVAAEGAAVRSPRSPTGTGFAFSRPAAERPAEAAGGAGGWEVASVAAHSQEELMAIERAKRTRVDLAIERHWAPSASDDSEDPDNKRRSVSPVPHDQAVTTREEVKYLNV
jgi:hypothetical protein